MAYCKYILFAARKKCKMIKNTKIEDGRGIDCLEEIETDTEKLICGELIIL